MVVQKRLPCFMSYIVMLFTCPGLKFMRPYLCVLLKWFYNKNPIRFCYISLYLVISVMWWCYLRVLLSTDDPDDLTCSPTVTSPEAEVGREPNCAAAGWLVGGPPGGPDTNPTPPFSPPPPLRLLGVLDPLCIGDGRPLLNTADACMTAALGLSVSASSSYGSCGASCRKLDGTSPRRDPISPR